MRIGVIAPEFPPMLGGMAELARGLTQSLATDDQIRVYSFPSPSAKSETSTFPFPHIDRISGRPYQDLPWLVEDEPQVDFWLALNAGLIPLAGRLTKPFFCYLHGNDFINPWLACGPRWLETFRRPYVAEFRHYLRRRAILAHLHSVRHVLTNSHQTADLIHRRLGLSDDRVSVVFPGVADAFFQPNEPAKDSSLRILTVTRISRHTRRKNVDGVLRALAQIGDRFPWTYTVVGDGDDRPRLEALAEELGLGDRVTFTGSVSFDQLLAAYRNADLFVLASRATDKDVEGFGIVYMEASAGGAPVICSREGGATDAVREGVNGLLIDRSTPESIAEGISRFVDQRESFNPDSVRAVAEEFRWPRIAARAREVLRQHLTDSKGKA